MQTHIRPLKIGILGGGQLGKMIASAAQKLGHKAIIFTDDANSCALDSTNQAIIANYDDKKSLEDFAEMIDIATLEFENINLSGVEFLSKLKPVFPSAKILEITQNRLLEKEFLQNIGVLVTDFLPIRNLDDLENGYKKFGKSILKTATMGYDGKGQFVIENIEDTANAWQEITKESTNSQLILEKFCPFSSEISIIIARAINGEISCFEPLTNVHKNGILDKSFYPAKIDDIVKKEAQEIANKIAQNLDLKGILAIEFFVTNDNKLLVNEMAPRPHNSGHFSLDGAITSQFEQLIRAITNLPLGSTKFHSTGFMQNLIGDEINNISNFISDKNAKIHIYGKNETKKGRKMGHINILT